jgi:DNA-directed RNA polymerase specialized sigma24 family protein
MVLEREAVAGGLDALLEAERPRLIRLCARIVGDAGDAEDLAQETLLEAWRHRQKLDEPSRLHAVAHGHCAQCVPTARTHAQP